MTISLNGMIEIGLALTLGGQAFVLGKFISDCRASQQNLLDRIHRLERDLITTEKELTHQLQSYSRHQFEVALKEIDALVKSQDATEKTFQLQLNNLEQLLIEIKKNLYDLSNSYSRLFTEIAVIKGNIENGKK
jgi:septal ring factor EnvC (AmiA/AmiB activator)